MYPQPRLDDGNPGGECVSLFICSGRKNRSDYGLYRRMRHLRQAQRHSRQVTQNQPDQKEVGDYTVLEAGNGRMSAWVGSLQTGTPNQTVSFPGTCMTMSRGLRSEHVRTAPYTFRGPSMSNLVSPE